MNILRFIFVWSTTYLKSAKKIKCTCDYKTNTCSYTVGGKDWVSHLINNQPLIPIDDCAQKGPCRSEVTDDCTLTPTDPVPTDPVLVPEWTEWSNWTACSVECGVGDQSRSRECSNGPCEGPAVETKQCVGPNGSDCQTCSAEVPLNKGEIESGLTHEDVFFQCSDSNMPGSVCEKSCAQGFYPSGRSRTKVLLYTRYLYKLNLY